MGQGQPKTGLRRKVSRHAESDQGAATLHKTRLSRRQGRTQSRIHALEPCQGELPAQKFDRMVGGYRIVQKLQKIHINSCFKLQNRKGFILKPHFMGIFAT
jgi:hypothetical protein